MDGNSFRTLGECEFGTVWFVEGEGKVVVNAYQAALYFNVDDFLAFSRMISEAKKRMGANEPAPSPAPAPAPAAPSSSKIRQFRPSTENND